MNIALIVAGITLWVFLALIMADGARMRKKGAAAYFFLSLILSPFVAFMILMLSAPLPVVDKNE